MNDINSTSSFLKEINKIQSCKCSFTKNHQYSTFEAYYKTNDVFTHINKEIASIKMYPFPIILFNITAFNPWKNMFYF